MSQRRTKFKASVDSEPADSGSEGDFQNDNTGYIPKEKIAADLRSTLAELLQETDEFGEREIARVADSIRDHNNIIEIYEGREGFSIIYDMYPPDEIENELLDCGRFEYCTSFAARTKREVGVVYKTT